MLNVPYEDNSCRTPHARQCLKPATIFLLEKFSQSLKFFNDVERIFWNLVKVEARCWMFRKVSQIKSGTQSRTFCQSDGFGEEFPNIYKELLVGSLGLRYGGLV